MTAKGSVFDNATGKFLASGFEDSPHISALVSTGNIFVSGVFGGAPNYLILVNGQPVADTDRINEKANKNTADATKLSDAKTAKKDFDTLVSNTNVWNTTQVDEAMGYLLTILDQLLRD